MKKSEELKKTQQMLTRVMQENKVLHERVAKMESHIQEVALDDGVSNEETVRQAKVLERNKKSGSTRESPQYSPTKKTSPMAVECPTCGKHFVDQKELSDHIDNHHKQIQVLSTTAAVASLSLKDANANGAPRIPVIGTTGRQYNCRMCDFQGNSSKNLFQHVRETKHSDHDDLREKCFTCGNIFENFVALMIHRRESHADKINQCRYQQNCKFTATCWYRHRGNVPNISPPENISQKNILPSQNNSIVAQSSGFPTVQEQLPPDQMDKLFAMLQQNNTVLMEIARGLQGVGSINNRSQGF